MGAIFSAVLSPMSIQMRLLLFGLAAAAGTLGGYGWSLGLSDLPYDAMLRTFLEPGFQIVSLTVAVALGFTLGFAHIVRICYMQAELAVLQLLQATRDKSEFIRVEGVVILRLTLVYG